MIMQLVLRLGYRFHEKGIVVQFLAGAYGISSSNHRQVRGSMQSPIPCTKGCIPRKKIPRNDASHSPVCSAKIMDIRGYISLPHMPSYKIHLYIDKRILTLSPSPMMQ
jgi:hypothetical protein